MVRRADLTNQIPANATALKETKIQVGSGWLLILALLGWPAAFVLLRAACTCCLMCNIKGDLCCHSGLQAF
jgi:hypothetical protein